MIVILRQPFIITWHKPYVKIVLYECNFSDNWSNTGMANH